MNKSCSFKKKFLFLKKKIVSLKKTLEKKIVSGTQRGGFQFIVVLTPQGVPFHPVVDICLGKNLLLKSVLGHCVCIVAMRIASLTKMHQQYIKPGYYISLVCITPANPNRIKVILFSHPRKNGPFQPNVLIFLPIFLEWQKPICFFPCIYKHHINNGDTIWSNLRSFKQLLGRL